MLGKDEKLPYASLQTTKSDSVFKRIMFFIRSQLVSPDARVIWNKYALKAAEEELKSGVYKAVITTGPPHSTHLVGLKLKKKYGVKWIADFRDPWSKIYYLESGNRNKVIKNIDLSLENKVLKACDVIVTVSKGFSNCLNVPATKIIPSGFDPDDYLNKEYKRSDCFRIKFVGALTDSRKQEVLNTLSWINEYASAKNMANIEFTLVGAYEVLPDKFQQIVPCIKMRNVPFVEHEKVIEECIDSEILLLVINLTQNNQGILPFKLFEYIGSKTYILGIGPDNSDVKMILQETQAGEMFGYEAKEEFIAKLDELYQSWESGNSVKNTGRIEKYSLAETCGEYVKTLEELLC